ncbi:MAG: hydrogenase expression/formation protein HypE, partial [Magnetococcus sp. WYHC-3]
MTHHLLDHPPLDREHGVVERIHGSGGRATARLIRQVFHPHFTNPLLDQNHDATLFTPPPGRLVLCTDAHVVTPIFFPGGDLGSLAVHGTVNDLAMAGAQPLHLTAAFILEEGYPLADLQRLAASMGRAAREAGLSIVAGDTKVVEHGHGDGVFISTTGLGVVPPGVTVGGHGALPGDDILISGPPGEHGLAVLLAREGLTLGTPVYSDSAALHTLVAALLAVCPEIHCLRDPTRGGL